MADDGRSDDDMTFNDDDPRLCETCKDQPIHDCPAVFTAPVEGCPCCLNTTLNRVDEGGYD